MVGSLFQIRARTLELGTAIEAADHLSAWTEEGSKSEDINREHDLR
jgi:hypothetical protein